MRTDQRLTSQHLIGRWMHAHEEDPQDGSGLEVYRPSDWPFGPSRGRQGFELKADHRATLLGIAAADGIDSREGSWSISPKNVLLIDVGRSVRRLLIYKVTPQSLVVRELIDSQ